jgi:non-heme chloroperoxidase
VIEIRGAGGVPLVVREGGDPAGPPVVLVHGWAASGRSWQHQLSGLTDCRVLAVDLRGHGESGSGPLDDYADPAVWAEDLAAVLALADAPAVLVGWSYGGLVITDYLRERGQDGVAGLLYTGAVTELGKHPGGTVGPAWDGLMRAVFAEDPAVAVPALTTMMSRMTAEPPTGELVQRWLGDALRVSPAVRRALFRRDIASADVLAAVTVPTLVVHGELDAVISPAAAEFTAATVPGAELRWFAGVGHLPFAERPAEFTAALRDLVRAGHMH